MLDEQPNEIASIEMNTNEAAYSSTLLGAEQFEHLSSNPITVAGEEESSPTRETLTISSVIRIHSNSGTDNLDIHLAALSQDIASIQTQNTNDVFQSQLAETPDWTEFPLSHIEDDLLNGGLTRNISIPQKESFMTSSIEDELLNGGMKNNESYLPEINHVMSFEVLRGEEILIEPIASNHTLGAQDFNAPNIGLDDNSSTPFIQPENDIFNPNQVDMNLF